MGAEGRGGGEGRRNRHLAFGGSGEKTAIGAEGMRDEG